MEQLNVNNKRCCRCKEELQLENFGKIRSTKDGLQSECKECHRTNEKLHYKRIQTIHYLQCVRGLNKLITI